MDHEHDSASGMTSLQKAAGGVADCMGVPLVRGTTAQFIQALLHEIRRNADRQPLLVTYLNAWCSNIAAGDSEYAGILRRADAVYADGQGVVWAMRVLGTPVAERINAADFILDFCREAAGRGVSLCLLGSEEGVAARAAAKLIDAVPGLRIAAAESGYFEDKTGDAAAARVRASGADLLILGMGVPRQEKWASARLGLFGVKAVWCVGAMFEYYGEARARAPVWVRKIGLEWAFRLVLEPGRLWRRYLVGNFVFVWRVLRHARGTNRRNP